MASITLLHSAYGLRPAVLADAERLRAAGHEVQTPDLYDGAVFDDVDSGMAYKSRVGTDELVRRALAAAEGRPAGEVYGGYSLGASIAQHLFETRPAAGALFIGHAYPPEATWPGPAQAHIAHGDPWVDEPDVDAAAAAGLEVFRYDGGHLFSDPDLPDYDAPSAARMWERVLAFLESR